jgi:hypothetical protein
MTVHANTLSYDFDEEGIGFGKPRAFEAAPSQGPSAAQKAALAVVSMRAALLVPTGARPAR